MLACGSPGVTCANGRIGVYHWRRFTAAAVWALAALSATADGFDLDVAGFVQLDHYGLVAPERFYTNERLRLTAVAQLDASSDSGDLAAFVELIGFAQYGVNGFDSAPSGATLTDLDNLVRQAYVALRLGPFDLDIGKKFVRWGKADLLSPLDVVNHGNTELLALDDVLGGARADPVVHAIVYPSDDLSLELVYVPFLAPDLVAIEELAIDTRFDILGDTFDVDARFLNPPVTPFSEWAHSVHAALSYSTFVADLQVSYSYFRDQLLDFDLSGLVERRSADGTRYDIGGTVTPAYRRAHNLGVGASLALDGWVVSADAGFKFAAANLSGSRIDTKNPELVTVLQADHAFAIGSQPFTMLAGVYHRQVLHDPAAWRSDYSPFLEAYVGTLADQYLLQHRPHTWYLVGRLHTTLLRERLGVGALGVWGITEEAFHLAPRISYAVSDTLSVAAGANLWWLAGDSDSGDTDLLRRDDAKDNVFLRTTLHF